MRIRHWILATLIVSIAATVAAVAETVGSGDAAPGPAVRTPATAAAVSQPPATDEHGAASASAADTVEPATGGDDPPDPAPGPAPTPRSTDDGERLTAGIARPASVGPGDTALFWLDATAGDWLRVRVDGKDGMDPVTRLLGPEGALLAENDDESSVNRDSLLIARVTVTGPQFIEVIPFDAFSAGAFHVTADILPPVDEGSQRTLAPGDALTASLAAPADRDVFLVELEGGSTVSVTADGAVGVDTYLEAFAPDGAFAAADDDSGHGLDAAVVLTPARSGLYRVEVTPVNAKVGPYTLRVATDPPTSAPGLPGATAQTDHPAADRALDYWGALQRDDATALFDLAGPEALRLWGWESAADVQRDLPKLRSVGITGFPERARSVVLGGRARTVMELVRPDGAADGTLLVDATLVDGAWRVEFVQRLFARDPGGYGGPLPPPTAPPPLDLERAAAPFVRATAAVVIDAASGRVLFEQDAHRPLPPASLTKIATAILAVEAGDLTREIDIDVDAGKLAGSSLMGLKAGDSFSLEDLLYGLMLVSGNDAALAIGRAVAGDDATFVAELNALLARVGLADSHFTNPHGLDADDHRASAYDLAMLARYGMSLPQFRTVVSTVEWTAEGSRTIGLRNTNALLGLTPGADGVKTGYTKAAKESLVASATRDGHQVIVALLNDPQRYGEADALLEWAFANFCWPDGGATTSCPAAP